MSEKNEKTKTSDPKMPCLHESLEYLASGYVRCKACEQRFVPPLRDPRPHMAGLGGPEAPIPLSPMLLTLEVSELKMQVSYLKAHLDARIAEHEQTRRRVNALELEVSIARSTTRPPAPNFGIWESLPSRLSVVELAVCRVEQKLGSVDKRLEWVEKKGKSVWDENMKWVEFPNLSGPPHVGVFADPSTEAVRELGLYRARLRKLRSMASASKTLFNETQNSFNMGYEAGLETAVAVMDGLYP